MAHYRRSKSGRAASGCLIRRLAAQTLMGSSAGTALRSAVLSFPMHRVGGAVLCVNLGRVALFCLRARLCMAMLGIGRRVGLGCLSLLPIARRGCMSFRCSDGVFKVVICCRLIDQVLVRRFELRAGTPRACSAMCVRLHLRQEVRPVLDQRPDALIGALIL